MSHNAIKIIHPPPAQKLEPGGVRIATVRGLGYCLESPKPSGLPPRPGAEGQRSCSEILDWMLAPLLFVWPISIAITHYFANVVAAYNPMTRPCGKNVTAIARQIRFVDGKPVVKVAGSARPTAGGRNRQCLFPCAGPAGKLLAGDKELPTPAQVAPEARGGDDIAFRDDELNGEDLRVAYQYLSEGGRADAPWLLVEVGKPGKSA